MPEIIWTSPETPIYNCIAWAAGDDTRWWEPADDAYWPNGISRIITFEVYVQAFATLGYESCDNEHLEHDFEKVAIFVGDEGEPTHAARQLENGKWTSKLGQFIDVEHELHTLRDYVLSLGGQIDYGYPAIILKRRKG